MPFSIILAIIPGFTPTTISKANFKSGRIFSGSNGMPLFITYDLITVTFIIFAQAPAKTPSRDNIISQIFRGENRTGGENSNFEHSIQNYYFELPDKLLLAMDKGKTPDTTILSKIFIRSFWCFIFGHFCPEPLRWLHYFNRRDYDNYTC